MSRSSIKTNYWDVILLPTPAATAFAVQSALERVMSSKVARAASKIKAGPAVDSKFFLFKNRETKQEKMFAFLGYGLGAGVALSSGVGTSWTRLDNRMESPMSFDDLSSSWGRITSFGAGLGIGVSKIVITAFNSSAVYFNSCTLDGTLSLGEIGLSSQVLAGRWKTVT